MTITAKQNADGTIMLTGALLVTTAEAPGGLLVSADSPIPMLDVSAAKLATAKADIAALSAAVAKLTSDLA